jgi:O-antigen/teichoic acid export membrane protein
MTLGVGQFCGYGVQLAAIPLLTRLYTPDEFGQLAAFSGIVAICTVVATLRYEAAIPLADNSRQAFHLLLLTGGLAISSALLCGLVLPLLAEPVLGGLDATRPRLIGALIALGIAVCGSYQGLVYWLLHREAFGKLVMARLALSIGTVGFQVGLGMVLGGGYGLIFGYAIGYALAGLLIGLSALAPDVRQTVTISEGLAIAKHFRRFPQFGVWGALVGALAVHLPAILFAALFGPMAAGLYLLAHRCLSVPMSLLHYPVSRVYLSEAARLSRERPADLPAHYRDTVRKTLVFSAGPMIVAMLAAPALFELVFGQEWSEAGVLCRMIAPLMLAQLIWTCVQSTLDVLGRQDLDVLFAGSHAGLVTVALVAGFWTGASVSTTAILVSVGGTAGYVLSLGLTWRLLKSTVATRDSSAPSVDA